MNLDAILAAATENPTADPEEMGRFIDELIDAEDMGEGRGLFFRAGYMAGLVHAMAIVAQTGDPGDILGEMMAKETVWAAQEML